MELNFVPQMINLPEQTKMSSANMPSAITPDLAMYKESKTFE